jgi:hypothetical protein
MRKVTKRHFGAVWLVFGCAVSLVVGGACAGRSVRGEDDVARGGNAGERNSRSQGGTSTGARAGGFGGTGTSTGGVAGIGRGGSGGRGGTGSSGDAGEPGTAGEAPDGSGGTGGVNTGTGGSGGWMLSGICEQRSQATVTTSAYAGYAEFIIISEQALLEGRADNPADEDLVCRIRFEVNRVGAAPAGCTDLDGVPCEWSHSIAYRNPEVLIDENGACARSEIGWDQAFIDETDGSRVSYGYLTMFLGHDSVLMIYSQSSSEWTDFARATWNEATGAFEFKNRLGPCRY